MREHISVFTNELIDLLQINKKGVYVDLTLGSGGHSKEILNSLQQGTLYSFDVDSIAVEDFKKDLLNNGFLIQKEELSEIVIYKGEIKVHIIRDNFEKIDTYIQKPVDGIIADLGWSSDQLGSIKGLAYSNDNEELDMRFDKNNNVKAADLLQVFSKKQLTKMFEEYGDIYGKENKEVVDSIIEFRKHSLFKTVGDLKSVIDVHLLTKNRGDSLLPRIFQALRITVNRELSILQNTLPILFNILGSGSKLVIVTFHSGESKVTSEFFNDLYKVGRCTFLIDGKEKENGVPFQRPSVKELQNNLRARSAKLFAIEKNGTKK